MIANHIYHGARMTTAGAARWLHIPALTLSAGVRTGRFPTPAKDSAGQFIWTREILAEVRRILDAGRRRPSRGT